LWQDQPCFQPTWRRECPSNRILQSSSGATRR
jgi:hypothetical protein